MSQPNPLLDEPTTPFGLPPFDQIVPANFPPAFASAMQEHLDEIEAIATNPEPATFANTMEAMERAGQTLTRVATVFWNLAGAHTTPEIQALERDLAPKMAEHANRISSNRALFDRIDELMRRRDDLGLTPEQNRLLEKSHDNFVRAGAALEGEASERLRQIKAELARLGTQFSQNVLADESQWHLCLDPDNGDLDGLPEFVIDAAASAAAQRDTGATHVVTLSRSLIEPFLMFSARRDLRQTAFTAWANRGANGGATDNRQIVASILRLRAERAHLLGFDDFADYKLANTMAGNSEQVRKLLDRVWEPAVQAARREAEALEGLIRQNGINDGLKAWDWRYYAARLRKQRYALDESELKPYFALDSMIAAAFHVANRLFGLNFEERTDLALYHDDVRAWDVTDANGAHVAVFLGDYFARASKRSGAWMSGYRTQSNLDARKRPIVVNVCNFAKAPQGQPTLLSFDDARTLFHEFGHALHGMLSDVTYASLAGTNVARDFVELPSQLFEHWLETDDVLSAFARHVETGDPMPDDLRAKLKAARNFNQGFATVEYLASAIVDMALHEAGAEAAVDDPIAFQADVLERISMPEPIAMRHAIPHFQHIFAGDGYAAGYYSYMWSEVLDADAFRAFEDTGNVFAPDTARRLKDHILSAGATRKETDAYVAFRGRLPNVEGLLDKRGLG